MPKIKKGGDRQSRARNQSSQKNGILAYLSLAGDIFSRLVDRFGWPGLLLILGFLFVEQHATESQKQEIIDKFILGKEISSSYPIIALGILLLLVTGAQNYYFKRRERILQNEIDRLAAWKSAHQEENIAVDLHHTAVLPGKE